MPDSWRNILDRAAENLSVDLNQNGAGSIRQEHSGWPSQYGAAPRPHSFADLSNLLEHEIEVLQEAAPSRQRDKKQAAARPSSAAGPQAAMTQEWPENSGKKSPLGELAPTIISVAIVALTIYAIYNMLH